MLEIISITKDDLNGILKTIKSTKSLRKDFRVKHTVVDSSKPDIAEQIRALSAEDGFNYIWLEPNGISQAFNAGVLQSEGEWLWFLNGGDQVHSTLDANLFLSILEKSTADAAVFQLEMKQSQLIPRHLPLWDRWPFLCNWMYHPCTIIRKRLFGDFGLFDEKLKIAMDNDVWLRVFANNVNADVISIPITLFDETGISSIETGKSALELRQVFNRYLKMIIKKWFENGLSVIKVLRSLDKRSKQTIAGKNTPKG